MIRRTQQNFRLSIFKSGSYGALDKAKVLSVGGERRQFMAWVVQLLSYGEQRKAERELEWDRKAIIKGVEEITSGIRCAEDFAPHTVLKPFGIYLPV